MTDLRCRGLLDSTLIVWMGEFGRTPKINETRRPRPLPQRLVDRAGRRRDQGRPGDRQHRRRRRGGQGPARHGARPARDRRQGPGDRPDQAEHRRQRPADPARRPEGQTRSRKSWDDGRSGLSGRSPWLPPPRKNPRRPRPRRDAARHLVFLAENRPVFLRLRITSGRPAVRGVVDRLGPGASRHPRPQRRRQAHDQGGRPQDRSPRSSGWRPARPAPVPLGGSWTSTPRTASSRSTSWPRPSARSWARSGSRSGGRRSAAPTRSSTSSTATRTASSPGPSWRRSPDRCGRSTSTTTR